MVTLTARATTTTLEQTGFLAGVRSGWMALAQFFAHLFTVVARSCPSWPPSPSWL